jgi:hypothetical protein
LMPGYFAANAFVSAFMASPDGEAAADAALVAAAVGAAVGAGVAAEVHAARTRPAENKPAHRWARDRVVISASSLDFDRFPGDW